MEIKLCNADCGYKKKVILDNINLLFKTGEIYSILGSNGIGKTTLFKSILGFIDLIGGDIFIDGQNVENMSNKEIATKVSYVPQAKNYSLQYSVFDIVLMGRALHIKKFESPSKNDFDKVNEVISKLKIDHLKDLMYSELSGGEQQIVLIARALAQGAKFIIMDEPASNLDFENQKKVLDLLKQLKDDDVGVIMSSHSPDHALYCNSKVVLIKKNKEVLSGSVDDLLNKKNLMEVYGVELGIISETDSNGIIQRSCVLL